MPSTTAQRKEQHERWNELARDPLLSERPYKVETNARGQIVLSPHTNRPPFLRKAVQKKFDDLLSGGEAFQELAIVTSGGTKQADVVWASSDRLKEMKQTGDPTMLAPEICVEVMSDSNDWEEMHAKRVLYREAGAEEVWVVDEDENVRFFGENELEHSEIAPDFPDHV
jgi:Uma2 family endonuclease